MFDFNISLATSIYIFYSVEFGLSGHMLCSTKTVQSKLCE